MTEILTPLTELDTDALLAVNGWKHVWADQFMYAYSGKWVWVPFYASILYVLFKVSSINSIYPLVSDSRTL